MNPKLQEIIEKTAGATPDTLPWAQGCLHEGDHPFIISCDDGTKYHRRKWLADFRITGFSDHHPENSRNCAYAVLACNNFQATLALATELDAEVERFRWQPIATAPKDGTQVLGAFMNPENGEQFQEVTWFQAGSDYDGIDRTPQYEGGPPAWEPKWTTSVADCSNGEYGFWAEGADFQPTHWMPLPAAPSLTTGEGGMR